MARNCSPHSLGRGKSLEHKHYVYLLLSEPLASPVISITRVSKPLEELKTLQAPRALQVKSNTALW